MGTSKNKFDRCLTDSKFHCDINYHLAMCTNSLAVALIYDLGYRLTHRKDGVERGRFFANAPTVAAHYGWDEKTFDRSVKILIESGFFILEWSGAATREASIYRVLSHVEWAGAHPGRCCVKHVIDSKSLPVTSRDNSVRD
jgi:hypothetical protein